MQSQWAAAESAQESESEQELELEQELASEREPEQAVQDLQEEMHYSLGANFLLRLNRRPSQSRTLRAATRELDRLHEHCATTFLPRHIKRRSRAAVPV